MKVTVYSTPSCPWCYREKEFLKEHKISFKDVDVSKDRDAAEEMINKSGQMGVPVTDANGTIIVGFDEPELRRVLKIK